MTEVLQDTVSLLVPATAAEIDAALSTACGSRRCWTAIAGCAAVDRNALLAAIDAVQDCVAPMLDDYLELEINPLIARPTVPWRWMH
jgi:hypothetical protein